LKKTRPESGYRYSVVSSGSTPVRTLNSKRGWNPPTTETKVENITYHKKPGYQEVDFYQIIDKLSEIFE
jgi:hypothetical protein